MRSCERCWSDAYVASMLRGTVQVDEYYRLLEENPDGHDNDEHRASDEAVLRGKEQR